MRLFSEFTADSEKLRHWLFDAALPLWWRRGADRTLGGYHEQLEFSGDPVILPRRSRVAARQAFCYSEAGRLGWDGPWRAAGQHALKFLRQRFVQSDGTVITSVDQQGNVLDPGFDLYNQAFALLAYASGHAAIDPDGGWRGRAHALIGTLKRDFAHPGGGFREDRDGRLPTARKSAHASARERTRLVRHRRTPDLARRGGRDRRVVSESFYRNGCRDAVRIFRERLDADPWHETRKLWSRDTNMNGLICSPSGQTLPATISRAPSTR